MTDTNPPNVDAAAVAGLAREVEALRRTVDELGGLPGRVEEIAELVARLCETTTAAGAGRGEAEPPLSWLRRRGNPKGAADLLQRLTAWLEHVYLEYVDARSGLPDCWLWHPEVVEELAWLMDTWYRAYHPDTGSVHRASDWHDRLRPGVVRRIGAYARTCSLDRHNHDGSTDTKPETAVPSAEACGLITDWWGSPTAPPPNPTPALLAGADARHKRRGARP